MTYLKLDVGFPWHPRVMPLSDRAFRHHVTALTHSRAYLTDGAIPQALPRTWGATSAVTAELERSGLWERTDAGWQLHDFLDYNPSKRQVEEISNARAAAGARGGQANSKQFASGLLKQTREPFKQTSSNRLSESRAEESRAEESRAEESRAEEREESRGEQVAAQQPAAAAATDTERDVGFSERYETIASLLPRSKRDDRRLCEEIAELANDFTRDELARMIALHRIRSPGTPPWPSKLADVYRTEPDYVEGKSGPPKSMADRNSAAG